jgi:hypothetical protein
MRANVKGGVFTKCVHAWLYIGLERISDWLWQFEQLTVIVNADVRACRP